MPYLSSTVLILVLILIMVRKLGPWPIAIWQAMLLGAIAVMLTGQISVRAALQAIDLDVMGFLFGMFVIGQALQASGYLQQLSRKFFSRATSTDALILLMLAGIGVFSALLMNDTLAIIGTPVALALARQHHLNPKLLLMTLAFAVTLGSVPSPIGNPQNLLIAIQGAIDAPFIRFASALALPTAVNLLIAFIVLRLAYKKEFHPLVVTHNEEMQIDVRLARWAKLSLYLVLTLIVVKIGLAFSANPFELRLTYIALLGAAPLLLFSPKRYQLLKDIDWPTLVFFAAMFILMKSVWNSGIIQDLIRHTPLALDSVPLVLLLSTLLSQLISNVPMVALYLPLAEISHIPEAALLALAAGSTIAGNMFIIGAASNVIIIQAAERHGYTLGFWEFARLGIPLTLLNSVVYWAFLSE